MKTRRIAAAAAFLGLITTTAMVMPMGAGAAGTTYSTTLTTEDDYKTTALDKYLVMNKDANVPNSSFTFTVTSGTAIAADTANGKLAVLAGVGTPSLKIGTGTAETDGNINMTFSTADAATAEASKGTDTPVFLTADTTDEKYVKKTLTLDFSAAAFSEPGVYRYIITETGTNQGIINGYVDSTTTETTRTLDVYVEDAGTTVAGGTDDGKPQLKITGYAMYNGTLTTAPNANLGAGKAKTDVPNGAEVYGAVKNNKITNVYSSHDLTFGKIVTGNQGSKDKYFKYTVVIDNITSKNAVLSVDLSLADTAVPASPNAATKSDYAGKTNPSELIADTEKTIAVNGYKAEANANAADPTKIDSYKITAEYYLQHGQYITIQGLPKNATYAVSEEAEDYTAADGITAALSTLDWNGEAGKDALSDSKNGTIDSKDIHTGFTNDRSGAIPTGLLSTVAGSAGLVAIGLAGIVVGVFYIKKKKSEEE